MQTEHTGHEMKGDMAMHDESAAPRHGGGGHGHEKMMRDMLAKWIWRDFANIILGFWLLTAPFTFGYGSTELAEVRSAAMTWSDIISGAIIAILGVMTLWPRFDLARWGICFTGIWLLFAPLIFWSPDAAGYANDTLVGALVIAFSVLIPMMPGKAHHMLMMTPGPETPPGWSYNPSTWTQRGPIIAMALVGFFLSRHLAAYQLGHIPYPWDPFFGDGTRRVLDSEVSKMFPISDAGLGAVAYMIEALSGFMGGRDRWRTMPWMVAMFGFLVVPLGVVSIVLVMLQPVAVGAWCTLCLVTAAAMLLMISPALDEVVAMIQFLTRARREGQPLWRTFWLGGTLRDATPKPEAKPESDRRRSLPKEILGAMELTSIPWNLLVSAAAGVWLMFAPAVFGTAGAAAHSDPLAGAMVVTFSVIAWGEVARSARFLNIPLGLWVVAAPFVLSGSNTGATVNGVVLGLLVAALSLPRGSVREQYANWNSYIR